MAEETGGRWSRITKDVTEAINRYRKYKDEDSPSKDLSAHGAGRKLSDRNTYIKNSLDRLDDDMKNAGQTEYERRIFGK